MMKTASILHSLTAFLEAVRKDNKSLVICYADRAGHTQLLWRETDAWLGSLDVAQNKAWTAIAFSGVTSDKGLTTEALSKLTQPGEPLYGLQNTNSGRVVIFGGGIPIYQDNKLVGSIGVSGSTVEDDIKYCKIAVDAYLEQEQS